MNLSHTLQSITLLALISTAAYGDAPSNVKEVSSQAAFDKYVADAAPLVVKFYSPRCGHCNAIKEDFEKLSSQFDPQDATFIAVDDTKSSIGEDYNIEGYPTFVLIKDKQVKHKKVGGIISSAEIKQYLGTEAKASNTETKKSTTVVKKSKNKVKGEKKSQKSKDGKKKRVKTVTTQKSVA